MVERDAHISVQSLSGGYDDQEVLRDITFSILRGEILVIVGRSGCGKSTLMRYLIGLAEPWSGSVRFEGEDIWGDESTTLHDARKRWGVLFQSGALLGSLTLLENVMLPIEELTSLNPLERKLVALRKLEIVGLDEFAGSYPLEVSGGMQKRAALARAMVLDPDVLFFDEPSAGLDPVTSLELDRLIQRINRTIGTTMVIVTHELESILSISDRIIMLDRETRGIIADGTAQALQANSTDPRVQSFFHRESLSSAGAE